MEHDKSIFDKYKGIMIKLKSIVIITGIMIVIPVMLTGIAESSPSGTVIATADPLWTDSGLSVGIGDVLNITATGTWCWDNFGSCNDPNGVVTYSWDGFLTTANKGELIAFIGPDPYQGHWGDGSFFPQPPGSGYWIVGDSTSIISDRSGKLWFGMNDDSVTRNSWDNSGTLTIFVNSKAPTPTATTPTPTATTPTPTVTTPTPTATTPTPTATTPTPTVTTPTPTVTTPTSCEGNTYPGQNVIVMLHTTGLDSVRFESVSTCGDTTITVYDNNQWAPLPDNYQGILFYDVETTATYTGNVRVGAIYTTVDHNSCINNNDHCVLIPSNINETDLRILHYEGGIWRDVTTAQSTTRNTMSGTVSSLSPFALVGIYSGAPGPTVSPTVPSPGGNAVRGPSFDTIGIMILVICLILVSILRIRKA